MQVIFDAGYLNFSQHYKKRNESMYHQLHVAIGLISEFSHIQVQDICIHIRSENIVLHALKSNLSF